MQLYYNRYGEPISQEEWSATFASWDRVVGHTDLGRLGRVSTVWLGLNHSFGDGAPLIFETMVFGGPLDEYIERYATEESAQIGHEFMVMRLQMRGDEEQSRPLIHNGRKPRR